MIDIVERLSANVNWLMRDGFETSAKNVQCALAEIESLRQRLAEKDAEIERLYKVIDANWVSQKQIIVSQLLVERLREALNLWKLASNNAEESELDDMACYCVPMPLFCDADEATGAALALPQDTTALEAMITKAGEVMRERAAQEGRMAANGNCEDRVRRAILSIANVTLFDLR